MKTTILIMAMLALFSSCVSMGVPPVRKLDIGMDRAAVDHRARLPDEMMMQLVDGEVVEYWVYVSRRGELRLWFRNRFLVGLSWKGKE